jgi:hypothetical protein
MTTLQRRLKRDEADRQKRIREALRRANALMDGGEEIWLDKLRANWPGIIMLILAVAIAVFTVWNL